MEDLLFKWCLEYSFSQNTFYAAPLVNILSQNREALEKGEQHDYILIGIYKTIELLEKESDKWAKRMKSKVLYTDIYGNVLVKPK